MKENSSDYILDNLTSKMVEDLIVEQELIQNGAEILYAIDTYDLINFCYPLGVKHKRNDKHSYNYYAHEQIALHYLFNNNNPIILDEYLPELKRWRFFFESNRNDLDSFINYADEFRAKLAKSADGEREYFLKNNLPLLISVSLGIFTNGYNIFSELVDSKISESHHLLIDSDDPLWVSKNKVVQKVFKEIKYGSLSKLLFGSLVKKRFEEKKNDQTLLMIIRELTTRVTDCQVADRIININNKFEYLYQEGALKQRYVLLYVSSTMLNRYLFEAEFMERNLPVINGKPVNFIRSTAQLFLLFYHAEKDTKKTIEKLKNVHNSLLKKDSELTLEREFTGLNDEGFLDKINKKIKRETNSFEYETLINLLNKHDEYKQKIQDAINDKNWDDFDRYFLDILKDAKRNKADINAQKHIRQIRILRNIAPLLAIEEWSKNSHNFHFEIKKGEDVIESRVQHLPVLFLLNSKDKIDPYKSKIDYLCRNIVESPMHSYDDERIFRSKLNEEIRNLASAHGDIQHRLSRELFVMLVCTILSSSLKDEKENSLEYIAYAQIKNNIDLITPTSNYYREFLYLGASVGRRQKDWENSLVYAEIGIKSFPLDPRFYHARSLINYNIYCQNKSENLLNKCLEDNIIALRFYANSDENFDNILVLQKTKGVVLGNITYLSTDLFRINKNIKLLVNARNALDQLKSIEIENYREHSEYLHTEARLELTEFEFWNLIKEDQLGQEYERLKKITNAYFAIRLAFEKPNINKKKSNYVVDLNSIENEFTKYIKLIYNNDTKFSIHEIFNEVCQRYIESETEHVRKIFNKIISYQL